MAYLGENGIVHRDLAARNILVAAEDLVKISDFGLARHVGFNGYYVVRQNAQKLPMPWVCFLKNKKKLSNYSLRYLIGKNWLISVRTGKPRLLEIQYPIRRWVLWCDSLRDVQSWRRAQLC